MTLYAVHTTLPPSHRIFQGETQNIQAIGDCFYGWGEPCDTRQCIRHTVLYGLDLEYARRLAHYIVQQNAQVVVTTHEDWSDQVCDASTPFYYRAAHQH
jgi:hypothetical protein